MTIQEIIFWVLFATSIGAVIWYIIGDSLTLEQILLVTILTMAWSTNRRLTSLETKFNFLVRDFQTLNQDFKEHAKHK